MKCNIDARGKRVRFFSGVVHLIAGVILLALSLSGAIGPDWLWIVAVALIVAGLFQVFEARASWCVVRAMGFRTPV